VAGRLLSAAAVGGAAGASGYGLIALSTKAAKTIEVLRDVTEASKVARVTIRAAAGATAGAVGGAEISVGRQLTNDGTVNGAGVAGDATVGALVGGTTTAIIETGAVALRQMGMINSAAQIQKAGKSTLGRMAIGAQTAAGGFFDASALAQRQGNAAAAKHIEMCTGSRVGFGCGEQ